jgi:hypothetical protein
MGVVVGFQATILRVEEEAEWPQRAGPLRQASQERVVFKVAARVGWLVALVMRLTQFSEEGGVGGTAAEMEDTRCMVVEEEAALAQMPLEVIRFMEATAAPARMQKDRLGSNQGEALLEVDMGLPEFKVEPGSSSSLLFNSGLKLYGRDGKSKRSINFRNFYRWRSGTNG